MLNNSNDFHIALKQYSYSYAANTVYKIVIGGWSNTASVIRYRTHDTCNNIQNMESEISLETSIVCYIIFQRTLPWRGGQVSSPLGFSCYIINYYLYCLCSNLSPREQRIVRARNKAVSCTSSTALRILDVLRPIPRDTRVI